MNKITAIYLRVSAKEKNSINNSISIQNQRGFLQNFLIQNPDLNKTMVQEFVDDGYTGTNFDRPAIQKIFSLMYEGKLNCIIVKDLSRFGRDYITTAQYLEQIFPFMGVRMIAVNDKYDSAKNLLNIPEVNIEIKNIFYSYFSSELSNKVLQAKEQIAQQGLFLAGKPPYGYLINPENKYQLIVDEHSAAIVKRIFQMFLEGYKVNEIVKFLNAKKIKTPAQRLYEFGIQNRYYKGEEINNCRWKASMVYKILRNPVVIGAVRNHLVERKKFGEKPLKRVDKKNWIVVYHKHKAIISEKEFEKTQKLLDKHV